MNARVTLALALAVGIGVAAWAWVAPPEPEETRSPSPAAGPPGNARPLPRGERPAPQLALAPAPRFAAAPGRPSVRPPTPSQEFLQARQYKALYERLKNSPEGTTPEGEYVLHQILRRCAVVRDGEARRSGERRGERREEFVAALPESDPYRDKRIAAFDDVVLNPCAGLEGLSVTQGELDKLLAGSAAAGDPRARALAIEEELRRARRNQAGNVTLTDAHVESLRSAASSGDPAAVLIAGRVLSSTWRDYSVRIGPEGRPAEPQALHSAWQVVACDLGYPCGESNPRLLAACAFQGHCEATSLPDYIYYYASSPHDSHLVNQYRGIVRNAVDSGDWSALQVVRGPAPAGRRFYFSPMGPRR